MSVVRSGPGFVVSRAQSLLPWIGNLVVHVAKDNHPSPLALSWAVVTRAQEIESISVVLTAQCNSHCSYCYQTARKRQSMDWATLRASIDLALTSDSNRIKLTFLGGEPLLEFQLIRAAVEYADQKTPSGKRLKCAISTNGLLITKDVAAFLDKHQIETQLSFDGIAEAQDYRKRGTFVTIDRLLDRLQDKHPDLFENRLRVCTTQIPATVPYLADSVRY